ncbi:SAV_6107 family HEPN domain-containing protein [Micromonospora aurantiaca (nom. illeg.)]|uniref:SAV_6107 family HEPN domain-containing protein n=1 Tax=Micromonospora aurantiaca (nom. illeg.) TaxID=47850 RepID=UPI003830EC56
MTVVPRCPVPTPGRAGPPPAAVLAARARPAPTRRHRITSVWVLLATVAPELDEWAAYFAAGASKRAAAEAGIPRVVTAREADDLLRAAEEFVTVVETALGLAHQPALDGLPRPLRLGASDSPPRPGAAAA